MKKKNLFFLKSVLFFYLIILFNGCTAMSLYYEKPPIQKLDKGEIYVAADDQRLPDYGGNDPSRVGTIRNTLGMPFALRARTGREPVIVMKELASDCLKTAGYQVSEKSKNRPQLYVIIKSFWSDGYEHNRVWSEILVRLQKHEKSSPIWVHKFKKEMGVTFISGPGELDGVINKMLGGLKNDLIAEFKKTKFWEEVNMLR